MSAIAHLPFGSATSPRIPFTLERPEFEREFDDFYSTYPVDVSDVVHEMDTISAAHPEWLPYRCKALIYETAAKRCDVHVFRHDPFYFETKTGRIRNWWGFDGIGGWLMRQPAHRALGDDCAAWWKPYGDSARFAALSEEIQQEVIDRVLLAV